MALNELNPEQQIEKQIDLTDNLLTILAAMSDSDMNQQNTWLLIGEIESLIVANKKIFEQIKSNNEALKKMVKQLEQLYKQIIL